jgi:uncharacterized protein (TIGR01777 family)
VSGGFVVVTGGSGLVGRAVVTKLLGAGFEVKLVSRTPGRRGPRTGVSEIAWDEIAEPARFEGAAGVIHLAGEPIFGGLPTRARRERMWTSRVDSTRQIVETIGRLREGRRPRALACASAVGFYGDRGEEELTERSPAGSGYLADLCVAWEAEAQRAAGLGVRVARLRFGVVLSREGGMLAALRPLFGLALGGRVGSGRQWFSWIHRDDAAELVRRALEDVDFAGAFNAVAPRPVRNEELTRELARVLRRPALLPAPSFAVRLALGELAGELLGSRRVLPARAQALGQRFAHPELASALAAELGDR